MASNEAWGSVRIRKGRIKVSNRDVSERAAQLLHRILEEEDVLSVYQPIASLQSGTVVGYEALSRFPRARTEDAGMSVEALFCSASERGQLWQLEKLCREAAIKQAMGKPAEALLFLNVDPNVIHADDFVSGFTKELLASVGLAPEEIVFEITEREAIRSVDAFFEVVQHYRSQNFTIAVDDFGSKYSGLNRVCAFVPEYLKFDMELVRGIHQNPIKQAAVRAMVGFCREVGIATLAEGIETVEELSALIGLGVSYGQGYLLAHPTPEFVALPDTMQHIIQCEYAKVLPWEAIG